MINITWRLRIFREKGFKSRDDFTGEIFYDWMSCIELWHLTRSLDLLTTNAFRLNEQIRARLRITKTLTFRSIILPYSLVLHWNLVVKQFHKFHLREELGRDSD